MNILAFDENVRRQIRNVVDYANLNIYQVDDILWYDESTDGGSRGKIWTSDSCSNWTLDMLLSRKSPWSWVYAIILILNRTLPGDFLISN